MFAGAGFRVEIEHEPRHPRGAGCPEVLNRRQAECSGSYTYRRGAGPFGLGRILLMGGACCRQGLAGVKQIKGMPREVEESDQAGEGKETPQG